MIPKISSAGIKGGKTGKNTMSHAEFQSVGGAGGLSSRSPTRYQWGLRPLFVEKSCHDRQDELSRLLYSAGHAVQKRLARRKGVSRHRRMADRGGHELPGFGGDPGWQARPVA